MKPSKKQRRRERREARRHGFDDVGAYRTAVKDREHRTRLALWRRRIAEWKAKEGTT